MYTVQRRVIADNRCEFQHFHSYECTFSSQSSPEIVRGLFSAIVPNSSLAEVRMGLLIEPTHMEDEDEEQENEKEHERETMQSKRESRRESSNTQHADDT